MFNFLFLGINKIKKINYFLIPFALIATLFIVVPTIIIFYYAFFGSSQITFSQKVDLLQKHILLSIFRSFYIALLTLFFTLLIGYPLAYFLYEYEAKNWRNFLILLITFPIWSNFFIKLIGLKSCLDYLNGSSNSTFGVFFTILGLIYIYLPLATLTIFNSLSQMSKNLIFSSQDLGSSKLDVFFRIIIPWTKTSLIATIALIFLPALFSVTASEFLNNENGTKMIAETLNNIAVNSLDSDYAKTQISFLVVTIAFFSFILFLLYKIIFSCCNGVKAIYRW